MAANSFWFRFLSAQYSKNLIVKELVVYLGIKELLKNSTIDTIVYPYEEKGYERALLMACEGYKVRTIGFTPHPQHHLALSMRDYPSSAPKPSQYAACGLEYVNFFEQWAQKPKGSVSVWGSSKARTPHVVQQPLPLKIRILLLLSHPEELRIFASWLKAVPALRVNRTYVIRGYKSVPDGVFATLLVEIMREYDCVIKDTGSFDEDIRACDLAIFDATSAGIMAIFAGKIAIHVCLDDLFSINPCFNNLDFVLSCPSAMIFHERLNWLQRANKEELEEIQKKQLNFVNDIFSQLDQTRIQKDIGC